MPKKGYKQTEEHRKKGSKARKGKPFTEAHKRNMGRAYFTSPLRQEALRTLCISNKGRLPWNKGIKGTPHTEAAKRKISEAKKGKPTWIKGKHHTEATKQKMSKARSKQIFPLKDTSIELTMQKELTNRKIPFTPHKYILGHQVDMFIKPNIIIECDGDYWHNRPEVQERDTRWNNAYQKASYLVLRYKEHEINANVEGCVDEIEDVFISH